MPDQGPSTDRARLLADVAEMYYLENKNQAEIAAIVGVTRSMVSRMLTEARQYGIVEIRVTRPVQADHELQAELVQRFGLRQACVVELRGRDDRHRLQHLGRAAAQIVAGQLAANIVVGLAWGSSVSATVDELEFDGPLPIKIVQLVGALGARNKEYDGHGLVLRLAQNLGGESYFINAPFICPSPEIARSLLETPGVQEAITLAGQAQLALLGVGSVAPQYSSFYLAGYVPLEELHRLQAAGAVGDVCGLHFDIDGHEVATEFSDRLVNIRREALLGVPVRLGVAGGPGKAEPILGAVRGGYINTLVTDSVTARQVLGLAHSQA